MFHRAVSLGIVHDTDAAWPEVAGGPMEVVAPSCESMATGSLQPPTTAAWDAIREAKENVSV